MILNKIKKFIIFCFVGGTSALTHLIVFNIFFIIFKNTLKSDIFIFGASLNYVFATIIGTLVSITYNFSMNRNITFSAKHEPVKRQVPRYVLVYTFSIITGTVVNLTVLNLLGENTLNANIATLCGIIASIPISFFGSLLWTFKHREG